jgi:hypothetical protein
MMCLTSHFGVRNVTWIAKKGSCRDMRRVFGIPLLTDRRPTYFLDHFGNAPNRRDRLSCGNALFGEGVASSLLGR